MTEVDDIPPPDFTRAPVLSLDVFAHPQRWLFAGECPPPLRDPRPWVRGIRATLLLGLMGWCVGGLGWLAMWIAPANEIVIYGTLFGTIVLLPVARWSGWRYGAVLFIPLGILVHASFLLINPRRDSLAGCAAIIGVAAAASSLVHRTPQIYSSTVICTLVALLNATYGDDLIAGLPISRALPFEVYQRWTLLLMFISLETLLAIAFCGPYWRREPPRRFTRWRGLSNFLSASQSEN